MSDCIKEIGYIFVSYQGHLRTINVVLPTKYA